VNWTDGLLVGSEVSGDCVGIPVGDKLAVGESVPRIGDIVGDFEGLIVGLVDVGGAEGDLNGLSVG